TKFLPVARSARTKLPTRLCRASVLLSACAEQRFYFASDCETRPPHWQIPPASRPLAHPCLEPHSVAYLNKIRFHPFPDENRINIKTVAHRGASVQHLRLGSVGEEETEIPGEHLVDVAKPGTSIVLRHEVQFDEQELCFRQSLFRARERLFF